MTVDPRNEIQRACTNLARSDTEFVVGEVYGLRQWSLVTSASTSDEKTDVKLPALRGHYGADWNLNSVNVARCTLKNARVHDSVTVSVFDAYGRSAVEAIVDRLHDYVDDHPDDKQIMFDLDVDGLRRVYASHPMLVTHDLLERPRSYTLPWDLSADVYSKTWRVNGRDTGSKLLRLSINAVRPIASHPVTSPECTCGFYAYTDVEALSTNSTPSGSSVFGLVKAYGHVTHGTKGFRAEKAEVLAVTRPQATSIADMLESLFAAYGLGSSTSKSWYPADNETLASAFTDIVPDGMAIYDDLDGLLRAALPLVRPYSEDGK